MKILTVYKDMTPVKMDAKELASRIMDAPDEIKLGILEQLVVSHDEFKYAYVIDPEHIPSLAKEMLQHLPKIARDGEIISAASILAPLAEECMLHNSTIFVQAIFPDPVQSTQYPWPESQAGPLYCITKLCLTVDIPTFEETDYRPTELYHAQDNILYVKLWFPNIQHLIILISAPKMRHRHLVGSRTRYLGRKERDEDTDMIKGAKVEFTSKTGRQREGSPDPGQR